MEKVLTVIIPIYANEEYLSVCLPTLLRDDIMPMIEIMIVDAGADDDTLSTAYDYVQKYPETIRVLKYANENHGAALNDAVKKAQGKYLKVVEGHDWVNTMGLVTLINYLGMHDVDMVINPYIQFNGDNMKQDVIGEHTFAQYSSQYVYQFDELNITKPIPFCEITYRTKLFIDNDIQFDDNLFYVDAAYVLYPIRAVRTITFLRNPVYVYHVNFDPQNLTMNVKETQDHLAQHYQIAKACIAYYDLHKRSLSAGKLAYVQQCLRQVINIQYYIWLSFPPSTLRKQQLMGWDAEVHEVVPEIYQMTSGPIITMLEKSHGYLYKLAALLLQHKLEYIKQRNRP